MAFLSRLPQAKDLAIGVLLFVVVMLMILPMPTVMVDGLIGLNFGIAMLLLMTGIYIATPLSLSSLPGIILISTIFRLALSITTTRLILSEGDAGAIIATFGKIVVGGNVVVGLVVFFIITIVQFIVIAKGAERIAEVGARFTLDALPGKQMAIDAELRNGDIDNVEASRRRRHLESESQFYGAMDGAMKFVKGDAIAGLIIIAVNLVGGLLIGIVQIGMPIGAAAQKYSLLTVGDALISQIPALLMSITAAIIVTRVKGEDQRNLGADIIGQVMSDARAIRLAGAALILMGLLPGFPLGILVPMGLVFVLASLAGPIRARLGLADEPAPAGADAAEPPRAEVPAPILPAAEDAQVVLQMAPDLMDLFGPAALRERLVAMADAVAERTGLDPCSVTAEALGSLEPGQFRLLIDGSPVLWSRAEPGVVILRDVSEVLAAHDIPFRAVHSALWTRRLEVAEEHAEALLALGLDFLRQGESMLDQARDGLVRNVGLLMGLQETREILAAVEKSHPVLVAEVLRVLPIQKVSEVFRRLLEERVSVANRRRILEALVEWAPSDTGAMALTEYCRVRLKQQICEAAADRRRTIAAIVVERESEDVLRGSLRDTSIGTYLLLDEQQTADLLSTVRGQIEALSPRGTVPVMMTSMDVRRHLKTFLTRNSIDVDVLSFQELSDDYTVVPCSTLKLSAATRRAFRRARPGARGAAPAEGEAPDRG